MMTVNMYVCSERKKHVWFVLPAYVCGKSFTYTNITLKGPFYENFLQILAWKREIAAGHTKNKLFPFFLSFGSYVGRFTSHEHAFHYLPNKTNTNTMLIVFTMPSIYSSPSLKLRIMQRVFSLFISFGFGICGVQLKSYVHKHTLRF